MALTNNHLNLQMTAGSFLRNKLYNSNTVISQEQCLNILSSQRCPTKPTPKLRRSTRLQNKQKPINIQINMNENKDVWMCKCCGELDINQTKTNCTRCNSPQIDSQSNPNIDNEIIVQGYCRVVIDVPAVVHQLIQNYLTLQKLKFLIIWTKTEVQTILKKFVQNSME
eukprot:64341_1